MKQRKKYYNVFISLDLLFVFQLNEYLEVSDVRADCNVRVGWSHDHTNLLVGEENASYGYDGSGLKCLDQRYVDSFVLVNSIPPNSAPAVRPKTGTIGRFGGYNYVTRPH